MDFLNFVGFFAQIFSKAIEFFWKCTSIAFSVKKYIKNIVGVNAEHEIIQNT